MSYFIDLKIHIIATMLTQQYTEKSYCKIKRWLLEAFKYTFGSPVPFINWPYKYNYCDFRYIELFLDDKRLNQSNKVDLAFYWSVLKDMGYDVVSVYQTLLQDMNIIERQWEDVHVSDMMWRGILLVGYIRWLSIGRCWRTWDTMWSVCTKLCYRTWTSWRDSGKMYM